MVAPVVAAAGISAVGSLLGGLFGKSKAKYVVPDYARIRQKAEEAGFNPLTALTSAPGSVVQETNTMGEAISNAALALADGLDPEKAARVEQLELQNQDLKKRLEAATLRPAGPGLYQRAVSYPPLPGQGGANGQGSGSVSSVVGAVGGGSSVVDAGDASQPLRPLPKAYPTDLRREVQHQPNNSTSGFMTIDNPSMSYPLFVPTIDGDEPLGFTDLPAMAVYSAGSWLYDDAIKRQARTRELNPEGRRYVDAGRLRLMSQQDHARGEGMLSPGEKRDLRRFSRAYKLAKPDPNRTLFGVPYTSR